MLVSYPLAAGATQLASKAWESCHSVHRVGHTIGGRVELPLAPPLGNQGSDLAPWFDLIYSGFLLAHRHTGPEVVCLLHIRWIICR